MSDHGEKVDIRTVVRDRYGAIAEKAGQAAQGNCCSPTSTNSCCSPDADASQFDMVSQLYQDPDLEILPPDVTDLSLGCGDPVTLASLEAGQTVLDLGSGGGIDCFLAAKKVGPTGSVIGVDMTPAMIEAARHNREKMGVSNVEFRLGEIEHLPVADGVIDVILSNCVINLSPDKPQVFREAFRVLKPGGRLAVSDIVTDGPLPDAIKTNLSAWAGCVAGALEVNEYLQAIETAGFTNIVITPSYWSQEMVGAMLADMGPEFSAQLESAKEEGVKMVAVNVGGEGELIRLSDSDGFKDFDPQKAIFSAKITATKPD